MLTKKQKTLYFTGVILLSIICLLLGLFIGKTYLKTDDKENEENNLIEETYYKDLYYTENGRNIYIYGKERILARGKDLILNENIWESIEELKSEFEVIETLNNNEITIYRTKGNSSEIEKYTMIICNTKENNKDIYFGPFDMKFQQDFCKNNPHESFIKTYKVLNVADSNDDNYIYITIRGYNQEDVQTIKIRKYLNPNIKANNNYEFTFKSTSDVTLCDTILSIFKNTELLKIEYTDKEGLEQTNEEIKN